MKLWCLTSKFSKPKMSRMPMDLKFSIPLIFWLILRMIHEKHWEYKAIATESRESTAWKRSINPKVWSGHVCTVQLYMCYMRINVLTCSIVSGEQISSPLRIIERWVRTSESWKASSPSSSLTLVITGRRTEMHYIHTNSPFLKASVGNALTLLSSDLSAPCSHELNVPQL